MILQKSDCGSDGFHDCRSFSVFKEMKTMAYPGRHNIYKATIRRMVTQALQEQEQTFRQTRGDDPDTSLLEYLVQESRRLGHSPWPGEIVGGSYLTERFGSWESTLNRAGLPAPKTSKNSGSFLRVIEETSRQKDLYRKHKAEKKQLTQKRLAEQSAKRKAREER